MTEREIIAMFVGIVCGILLMGLLMLVDPPTVRVERGAASLVDEVGR